MLALRAAITRGAPQDRAPPAVRPIPLGRGEARDIRCFDFCALEREDRYKLLVCNKRHCGK